jgi:acetoin utilization protein AcuB
MSTAVPTIERYMTPLPYTIEASATMEAAHLIMREHRIRHLPVMQGGELVGLLSVRDLHLLESLKDVDPAEVPVADAMSRRPYTVAGREPIDKVAAHMAAFKIGSALVVEDDIVTGIFTTHDALRALIHLSGR